MFEKENQDADNRHSCRRMYAYEKKKQLDEKYRDHALQGKYKGFRECHVEPDWLLVYQIRKKEIEMYLFRTGTHSDLF